MKIETYKFIDLISKTFSYVLKTGEIPILSHLCFNKDKKTVSAYNLQHGCIVTDDFLPFNVCIPFQKLSSFFSNCSAESFEANLDEKILTLRAGRTFAKIPVEEIDDYPDFTDVLTFSGEKIPLEKGFIEWLKACSLFGNPKATRPAFQGVLIKDNKIAATDGFTIAKYTFPNKSDFSGFVVPINFVKILNSNVTHFVVDEKKILFFEENSTYFTNLIEEKFPEVDQFFPAIKKTIKLPKKEFQQALLKIGNFSEEIQQNAYCTIDFGKRIEIKYEGNTSVIEEYFDFGNELPKASYNINPYYFEKMLKYCDKFSFIEKVLYGASLDDNFKVVLALRKPRE